MGSPHYHAFSAELQNNVGDGDDLYVMAISDDMKHGYFGERERACCAPRRFAPRTARCALRCWWRAHALLCGGAVLLRVRARAHA